MKSKIKIITVSVLLLFVATHFVSAAGLVTCGQHQGDSVNQCTIYDLIQNVILIVNYLIGSASLLAIGYILYGGIRMILARGNPQGIQNAKDIMKNAIFGLIIVLLAFMIVNYVVSLLTGTRFSFDTIPQILNIGR